MNVVSVVVVEVAKVLATARGAWRRIVVIAVAAGEENAWGGKWKAVARLQQEETQARASSKERAKKTLVVVVVVILWVMCLCVRG